MPRPKFKPTDDQRELVKNLSALGIPQDDICTLVAIRSAKTLRKHFRRELNRGMTEANVKVGQTLFRMATSGQNLQATLFWMRTRSRTESRVRQTKAIFEVSTYQPPITEEHRKQVEIMLNSAGGFNELSEWDGDRGGDGDDN